MRTRQTRKQRRSRRSAPPSLYQVLRELGACETRAARYYGMTLAEAYRTLNAQDAYWSSVAISNLTVRVGIPREWYYHSHPTEDFILFTFYLLWRGVR